METCKWCDAWGIFHTLSDNGLCKDCNVLVVNRVQIHAQRLMNLIQAMKETDDLEAQLEICEEIVDEAELLCEFEKLSISTVQPNPRKLAGEISEYRERLSELGESTDASVPKMDEENQLSDTIRLAESMDPLGRWRGIDTA